MIDITWLKTIELALQAERHFWQSMLNAMDMQIVILNEVGQMVHMHQAWRDCDEATLEGADSAYVVSQGLRDVLTGARSAVTIAYRCSSTRRECLVRAIGFALVDRPA